MHPTFLIIAFSVASHTCTPPPYSTIWCIYCNV